MTLLGYFCTLTQKVGVVVMQSTQIIAERIKQQTKSKQITVKKMLADCNLGPNTVSKISNGTDILSQTILKIAEYLDCSVDYLLGRTDNPKMQSTTVDQSQTVSINGIVSGNIGNISNSHFEMSAEDMELIQLFHKLSIQKRAEIIMLMVEMNE